ncbi:MAG: TetR family transcriptional regulator C-terminal domain-containing protein [Solobacterium sp.]|jgi:hypothetical protein|nr:TetR family transcriptional regulator C-terminal domain-containing protein [Solobacterium sp.]
MILQTWLRRGFKESPEQIAEIYARASSILNNGV